METQNLSWLVCQYVTESRGRTRFDSCLRMKVLENNLNSQFMSFRCIFNRVFLIYFQDGNKTHD